MQAERIEVSDCGCRHDVLSGAQLYMCPQHKVAAALFLVESVIEEQEGENRAPDRALLRARMDLRLFVVSHERAGTS